VALAQAVEPAQPVVAPAAPVAAVAGWPAVPAEAVGWTGAARHPRDLSGWTAESAARRAGWTATAVVRWSGTARQSRAELVRAGLAPAGLPPAGLPPAMPSTGSWPAPRDAEALAALVDMSEPPGPGRSAPAAEDAAATRREWYGLHTATRAGRRPAAAIQPRGHL